MPTSTNAALEEKTTHPVFTAFRIFGRVVLLLMLVAVVYAAWMVFQNWSTVGV